MIFGLTILVFIGLIFLIWYICKNIPNIKHMQTSELIDRIDKSMSRFDYIAHFEKDLTDANFWKDRKVFNGVIVYALDTSSYFVLTNSDDFSNKENWKELK